MSKYYMPKEKQQCRKLLVRIMKDIIGE